MTTLKTIALCLVSVASFGAQSHYDGRYTIAWLLWGLMFFVIEVPAIINKKKGDTLSEHVWRWFSINGKGAWWRVRRLVLIFFLTWLVMHFLTSGWV